MREPLKIFTWHPGVMTPAERRAIEDNQARYMCVIAEQNGVDIVAVQHEWDTPPATIRNRARLITTAIVAGGEA